MIETVINPEIDTTNWIKPRELPNIFTDPSLTLENIREANPAYLKLLRVAGATDDTNLDQVSPKCKSCGANVGLCAPVCAYCKTEKMFLYLEDESTKSHDNPESRFSVSSYVSWQTLVNRDDINEEKVYVGDSLQVNTDTEIQAARANVVTVRPNSTVATCICPEFRSAARFRGGALLSNDAVVGSSNVIAEVMIDDGGTITIGKNSNIGILRIGKGVKVRMAANADVQSIEYCGDDNPTIEIIKENNPLKVILTALQKNGGELPKMERIENEVFENNVHRFVQPQKNFSKKEA